MKRAIACGALGLGLVSCSSPDTSAPAGGGASSGGQTSGGAGGVVGDSGWPDTGAGGSTTGGAAGAGGGGGSGGSSGAGGTSAGDCTALGPWQATAPFADASHVSHPLPSFGVSKRYYVHTMTPSGGDRVLKFAEQGADGKLGAWQIASADHGGGPHGFTALVAGGEPYHFRNGHIARYPLDASGKMTGDVVLVEADPNTAFGGNKYVWDSALLATFPGATWVVHLGGFSFTGYTYKPQIYRSKVPLAPSFTSAGASHPAARPGRCAFWAAPNATEGFVFTGEGNGSEHFRAKLQANGSLGSFTSLGSLPAGTDNQRGDWIVIDQTLFIVRGAKVLASKIGPGGALGTFHEQPPLPDAQIDVGWGEGHLEGSAHAVLGDWVYLTGKKVVYSAKVARNVACSP
jgi:hypothetical protein